MIRIWLTCILACGALFGLTACQTRAAKDFARIKTGMEKVDVIDIMGDPQRKIRRKGVDRWTYIYYDERVRNENEVHFDQGVATYVGPYVPPDVSAEERDRRNDAENRELEKRYAERRTEAQGNLERYQEEVETERAAPQYQPIDGDSGQQ